MIPGLYFALLEANRQIRLARAEKARMEDDMRRHLEQCEAFERALYGRDAIDVEAREVPGAPLLPP